MGGACSSSASVSAKDEKDFPQVKAPDEKQTSKTTDEAEKEDKEGSIHEDLDEQFRADEEENSEVEDFVNYNRKINPCTVDNREDIHKDPDFGIQLMLDSELDRVPYMQKLSNDKKETSYKLIRQLDPVEYNPSDSQKPNSKLKLEWVYGYRVEDSRNNIYANELGHLIYPAGGVVVKYDVASQRQTHLLEHTDHVICLCQHPVDKNIIATGQVATVFNRRAFLPHICIWNTKSHQVWILENAHQRAVRCMAFSQNGKYFVSVGDDSNYKVTVWNWTTAIKITTVAASSRNNKIFSVAWSSSSEFVTVGVMHICFWTYRNLKLTKKHGVLKGEKFPMQTFLDVAFVPNGPAVVGARDGSLYFFVKNVAKVVIKPHEGPVYSVVYANSRLITGGKDNKVILYNRKFEPKQVINFGTAVRSVSVDGNRLLIGTAEGEIFQVQNYLDAHCGAPETLMSSHHAGFTSALVAHPTESSYFLTAGCDNRLVLWDARVHRILKLGSVFSVAEPPPVRPSTRTHAPNQCARSVDFSPDGKIIALGNDAGELLLYNYTQLSVVGRYTLTSFVRSLPHDKDFELPIGTQGFPRPFQLGSIQVLKYSPCGTMLAAAYSQFIILLDTTQYRPIAKLCGHQLPITAIDWTSDSAYLRSSCRGFRLRYFGASPIELKRNSATLALTNDPDIPTGDWASQTVYLGNPVQGIFSASLDGTEVTTCDRSNNLLACGDTFGNVKLYRYPARSPDANPRISLGHAEEVATVRFSQDSKYLYSFGGKDRCIFQWRVRDVH